MKTIFSFIAANAQTAYPFREHNPISANFSVSLFTSLTSV